MVSSIVAGKLEADLLEGKLGADKEKMARQLAHTGLTRHIGQWRIGHLVDSGRRHPLYDFLGDPYYCGMADFTAGGRLGVDCELPWTTEVWPTKYHWPLAEFG
jgi:hypothetical protein